MEWIKMAAFALSLGFDTLMISISLGMVQTQARWKTAVVFASAEAGMPLIGLFLGRGAGRLAGPWASWLGGLTLVALAVWLVFFEDDEAKSKLKRPLTGWAWVLTMFSISLDELAVGFSVGIVGVPVGLTITLIALQAFMFTCFGLTFGAKLKSYLGEWAEKIAGLVLGLLGLWTLADVWIRGAA
ncbi:MAG: manganese efflux pump MntP family protein [Alicyclobacillus macrosporangiidus]|uniref:manganese efflux pump MntP n=1 Tax=Alicyclobacillus macrosporangiidus TaxID=392015 RepID=UPI0026E9B502|nr:manganese efflux pump [Alicyclobacillus macrosporangiidus]MCL6600370.1 manganese efflux pump MntP family protein [Alicyclobacillus macrosporangiidus]